MWNGPDWDARTSVLTRMLPERVLHEEAVWLEAQLAASKSIAQSPGSVPAPWDSLAASSPHRRADFGRSHGFGHHIRTP